MVHNLAREKAYCLSFLYLKISEYTHKDKKPFSNVFGAASRVVLQEFASIEEIAAIPFDELVEFIDLKGKRRFPDPTENARKLQRVAHDSYPLPQALKQPINLILGLSLRHITFLEGQEKRLNTAIAEGMEPIPHTLDTIPGLPVPATATCATTSARRPIRFGCATQSMLPMATASITRRASTNTSGPSCSPPASWSDWSFGC